MDKQKIEELLDQYFSDHMNEKEKEDFRMLLDKEPELKKAYNFEQKINENIVSSSLKEIKSKVANADKIYHKTTPTKIVEMTNTKSNTKTILSIAATLVLLVAAYFIINQNGTVQVEDQTNSYMAYLNEYENESLGKYALRGTGDDAMGLKDSLAMALHESTNGTVLKAKQLLQTLVKNHPDNEEVKLYLAIQMFKSSDYTVAINMLNPLIKSTSDEIREEAEMTMAMATSSLNDNRATSIKWLKKIASSPNHRHQKIAATQLEFFE